MIMISMIFFFFAVQRWLEWIHCCFVWGECVFFNAINSFIQQRFNIDNNK